MGHETRAGPGTMVPGPARVLRRLVRVGLAKGQHSHPAVFISPPPRGTAVLFELPLDSDAEEV